MYEEIETEEVRAKQRKQRMIKDHEKEDIKTRGKEGRDVHRPAKKEERKEAQQIRRTRKGW